MPSIPQLLQILENANFSLIGCQANNWLRASGTKTSFTVHQYANLFRANRFFRSLLPTSVIRSLLVLQITVNIADGEIGSYCFPAGNQHYAKCDLCSVICDLWFVIRDSWELNMAAWCWAHWATIDHVVHVNSSSSDFTALRGLLILKQQQQQKTLVYQ